MHIGKYLKKKREEMGYSQERLGELVEVSERTIRRIENNSNPKVNNTFEKICNILNIPLSDDKNIKKLNFNKDVDYLKPSEMLSKLELENSQALYFELDNKLMDAYRLAQEGNYEDALDIYLAFSVILPKEYIYIACANMYYMLDEYSIAIEYSEKALAINENSYEGLIIKGISLGKLEDYSDYVGVAERADLDTDTVYGIPNGLGADGIVYNKKVFAAAGYDEFPKTLDELYEALGKINEQDGVVPVAINSKDLWPLSQYDAVSSVIYGNPYYYRDMCKMDSPFSAGKPTGDMLEILYKFVSEGWVEQDLATTNWEQSKVDMANGKIGMMTLGMWAVSQIQDANKDNADDIGIAPFPATNSGELKAGAGPDQYLGVSVHSKHKEEAKDFAIYFANCLEYLDASGFIPANQKLEAGNPVVKAYQDSGVELMFADPAQADQAASDLTTEIANESGIKFWEGTYIQNAVIAAKKSREDFDKVIEDYNTKWNANKEKLSK